MKYELHQIITNNDLINLQKAQQKLKLYTSLIKTNIFL